jgi:hypothetical protein
MDFVLTLYEANNQKDREKRNEIWKHELTKSCCNWNTQLTYLTQKQVENTLQHVISWKLISVTVIIWSQMVQVFRIDWKDWIIAISSTFHLYMVSDHICSLRHTTFVAPLSNELAVLDLQLQTVHLLYSIFCDPSPSTDSSDGVCCIVPLVTKVTIGQQQWDKRS